MAVKISVEREACVGAGQCALVAGELFDQDDGGIVVVLEERPSESDVPAAVRAASVCPARAITLVDAT